MKKIMAILNKDKIKKKGDNDMTNKYRIRILQLKKYEIVSREIAG